MNRTTEENLSTADFVSSGNGRDEPKPHPPQEERNEPLLPTDAAQDLRARWDQVQTGFVDEPRAAVKQADELVAMAMKRLAESFSQERTAMERQWDRGDQVSTEDLRIALRKYRSFFQRLLAV
jgi:hypothetical protein